MSKGIDTNFKNWSKVIEIWLLIFIPCLLILKPIAYPYAEVVFIYSITIGSIIALGFIFKKTDGIKIPLDWPSCTLYGFTILEWISLLWADQVSLGLPIAADWSLLCLVYIFIRNIDLINFKESKWIKVAMTSLFINLVLVLGSLVYFNFGDLGFTFENIEKSSRFLNSHPNLLTSLFVLSFPGILYLLIETKLNVFSKALCLSIYIFIIIVFQSKGTIVALIGIILALLIFSKKQSRYQYVLASGIFSLGIIFILYSLVPNKIDFLSRYNPMLSYLNLTGDDRSLIWSNTLEMIKANPWLGVGTGNWKLAFLQFGVSEHTYFVKYAHAHNFYLQTFAEKGVFGILLLLELFYCPVYLYFKKRHLFSDHAFYFLLTLIGFYILCLFYGIAIIFKYLLIYIVTLGVFFNKDKSSLVSIPKCLSLIICSIFVFSIFITSIKFFQRLTFHRVENELIKGEASIQKLKAIHLVGFSEFNWNKPIEGYIADEYLYLKDYEKALTWYERGLSQSPNDAHLYAGLGTVLNKTDNYEKSLPVLKKATFLNSGDLNAQLELFRAAILMNSKLDIEKQIEIFETVIKIKDENYDFYLNNLEKPLVKSYWDEQCDQIEVYFSLLEKTH